MLVHVVDVSSPAAAAQAEAVQQVLEELSAGELPIITLWNKVDATADPEAFRLAAAHRPSTFCISAATGQGVDLFLEEVERRLSDLLHPVCSLHPPPSSVPPCLAAWLPASCLAEQAGRVSKVFIVHGGW